MEYYRTGLNNEILREEQMVPLVYYFLVLTHTALLVTGDKATLQHIRSAGLDCELSVVV